MYSSVVGTVGLLGAFMPIVYASIPYYCDPGKPYDQNALWYDDQTSVCTGTGSGNSTYNYCCTTMTGSGTCTADLTDQQTQSDLYNVINEQIGKGGQFDTSTVGQWRASYTLFQDAAQDPVLEQFWFKAIRDFVAGDPQTEVPGGVADVWLSAQGGAGITQILVERTC